MNKQTAFLSNRFVLEYFGFIVVCILVILAFITATTYIQLAIAILVYPVIAFLAYKYWQHKNKQSSSEKSISSTNQPAFIMPSVEKEIETPPNKSFGISDIDKRVFLKLIGGTGLVLFLYSILNKKSDSLFLKNPLGAGALGTGRLSIEGVGGNKIDPAQNQPLDGYNISEIEDAATSYYGFTNKDGVWYILRIDNNAGSFRYAKADSNFPGNWSNRENLNYDYFSSVF